MAEAWWEAAPLAPAESAAGDDGWWKSAPIARTGFAAVPTEAEARGQPYVPAAAEPPKPEPTLRDKIVAGAQAGLDAAAGMAGSTIGSVVGVGQSIGEHLGLLEPSGTPRAEPSPSPEPGVATRAQLPAAPPKPPVPISLDEAMARRSDDITQALRNVPLNAEPTELSQAYGETYVKPVMDNVMAAAALHGTMGPSPRDVLAQRARTREALAREATATAETAAIAPEVPPTVVDPIHTILSANSVDEAAAAAARAIQTPLKGGSLKDRMLALRPVSRELDGPMQQALRDAGIAPEGTPDVGLPDAAVPRPAGSADAEPALARGVLDAAGRPADEPASAVPGGDVARAAQVGDAERVAGDAGAVEAVAPVQRETVAAAEPVREPLPAPEPRQSQPIAALTERDRIDAMRQPSLAERVEAKRAPGSSLAERVEAMRVREPTPEQPPVKAREEPIAKVEPPPVEANPIAPEPVAREAVAPEPAPASVAKPELATKPARPEELIAFRKRASILDSLLECLA